ncbi:hypothetical protein BDV95DRAFT_663812 [Massariosphaeria phaeospora]|uniref:Uncharacterized protein n=1 Tax=Massariosphaeria phaeospora TaxID=100035 RepID=A0A7C8MFJ9_9PLEO|nr:hypothetical protein BDV95DRAFT_663812 [Massariosphaeria phaeospora]
MKPLITILLLSLMHAIFPALAQSQTVGACQCPQVKCPGDDAAALSSRAHGHGHRYRYANALSIVKQRCYQKCGGEPPVVQYCPQPAGGLLTLAAAFASTPTPKPTSTPKTTLSRPLPTSRRHTSSTRRISTPTPTPTHAICGGGRGAYRPCAAGSICMKDPRPSPPVPGCGPDCDGLGICVEDRMCGGFAGFGCARAGQQCVDDPRDDCEPGNGGWDCAGLCVWPL